ncbi:MAG: BCAM0308 family protein [Woeseiaceae bacterium]
MNARRSRPKAVFGNPRLEEKVHDPYREREKYAEPTCCSGCGAVYRKGRWQWLEDIPDDAQRVRCPACRRIDDRYPAGEIIVSGTYAENHADEILRLIRNTEKAESGEHPLHRIIDIRHDENITTITTTDVHLPSRIGRALKGACQGELKTHYDKDGSFVRVTWQREQ